MREDMFSAMGMIYNRGRALFILLVVFKKTP